jgi:NAD(P)-dependent dehydrogenase (short-subunit alcohol dehydrogenase family)
MLVIGGTRGLGRELVSHFVQQGSRVSVIGRSVPERKRRGVRYWAVDVRDETSLQATLDHVLEATGRINSLVLFQRYRGSDDPWIGELETSLTATKTIVESLAQQFAEGEKSIVVVSSVNATLVAPYLPLGYHVAKAALIQMVRYWAIALGPAGIRVNSVSPGTVLKAESQDFFLENRDLRAFYEQITPLRRFGHASEVAQVIAFLCGNAASFVTGQDIVVDGGISLQWQESLARDLVALPHPAAANRRK